jgi:hypothetical protein
MFKTIKETFDHFELRPSRGTKPGDVHWIALADMLGVTVDEIKSFSDEEIDRLVESHSKKKLTYAVDHHIHRGNVLLALGRFIDHTAIIARFNRIFG